MKPTLLILLFAGLFQACAPMAFAPQPKSPISCLGSVGKYTGKPFKKDFHKVSEPNLKAPIAVTVQSLPLTASLKSKHSIDLEETQKSEAAYSDEKVQSIQCFRMRIVDAVGLVSQLNSPTNQSLKHYLQEDKHLVLLTSISFVTDAVTAKKIGDAEHHFVNKIDGALTLELHGNLGKSYISMSALQVFEFETSGLCWKRNKRNQPEVAAIRMNGKPCPGQTEKDPTKLDSTQKHWKL